MCTKTFIIRPHKALAKHFLGIYAEVTEIGNHAIRNLTMLQILSLSNDLHSSSVTQALIKHHKWHLNPLESIVSKFQTEK